MKYSVRIIAVAGLLAMGAGAMLNAAVITTVEKNRTHTTTGAIGACTASAATNATPVVVTCTGAHGLVDGDGVLGAGFVTNTAPNATLFAKVTGYSATTVGLYTDAALSVPLAGNGVWASGGTLIKALDVSGLSGDFTLRLRLESMTANKLISVSVQESADGFASDIRTLAIWHTGAPGGQASKVFLIHSREIPTNRIGVTSVKWRLYVQDITSSTTAGVSLYVEQ